MIDNPLSKSFFDVVAAQAAIFPDRPAIIDGSDGSKTRYGPLVENAGRLASFLVDRQVGKGDRVGALALNCTSMVETMLACARIGAVFVPLNYRLSGPELSAIIADSDPRVFVHDGHDPELLIEIQRVLPSRGRRLYIGDPASSGESLPFDDVLASYDPLVEHHDVTPGDPWIICYTGGSTGSPKGAVLHHGCVIWNAINTVFGWGLRDDDVALVTTPLYHTGGLNVLLTPSLASGGCAVLVGEFEPDRIFDLIEMHSITWVFMVPTMYRSMLRHSRWEEAEFTTVRHFVTGGSPCPADVFEAFHEKNKPFRMGYGLTEAGPNTFHIDPSRARDLPGSVGKPLPFVDTMIDDGLGGEAEPGTVGELLIAGPHVFTGYWWRPEATAEVLQSGWLRTGDLARVDADGNHTIVGRIKEMFISGGENVYPSEVEDVLMRHPAVYEVAVVGVPDSRWGEVGKAAIVLGPRKSTDEQQLTNFCRDSIARYKVPKHWVFLDDLPRTTAGKVDKKLIAKM